MIIKLKKEWMGHPVGSVLTVANTMATRLAERGAAEEFKAAPKKAVAKKAVKAPTKQKMVRAAKNK